MILVVTLLGVLAAVVVPQLNDRDDLVVAAATRSVLADLAYAQNAAVTTQRRHVVRFTAASYTLFAPDDAGTLVALTRPADGGAYTVALDRGVVISADFAGSPEVAFDAFGTPHRHDPATNAVAALALPGRVTLRRGAVTLTIDVEPYTGEMSVR